MATPPRPVRNSRSRQTLARRKGQEEKGGMNGAGGSSEGGPLAGPAAAAKQDDLWASPSMSASRRSSTPSTATTRPPSSPGRFADLPPVPSPPSWISTSNHCLSAPSSPRTPDVSRSRIASSSGNQPKSILKHKTSVASLGVKSLASSAASTTSDSFHTASEGHEGSVWTPPVLHGIPTDVQQELLSPDYVGRPSISRTSTSSSSSKIGSFQSGSAPSEPPVIQIDPRSPSTPTYAFPPTTPRLVQHPTPVQNSYFLPSPARRMSEQELRALDDRTRTVDSPKKGRFGLPVFRQPDDRSSRARSASLGRRAPPPMERENSSGSLTSSSSGVSCCRGNGAIEGESVSDLALGSSRRSRMRSQTLSAVQAKKPMTLDQPFDFVVRPSPGKDSARSQTSSSESYSSTDRSQTPNVAWRESLLTAAVSFSLRGLSPNSSDSHLPVPPSPPAMPGSPSRSPHRRTLTKRRATVTSIALHDELSETPDFPALTIRRKASKPLLSDGMFSSVDSGLSSLASSIIEPSTPCVDQLLPIVAPHSDFDPSDFERPELYNNDSDPSHSGSSINTLPNEGNPSLRSASGVSLSSVLADSSESVQIRTEGDEMEDLDDDADSLVERGTLGELKERTRFGFSVISEESLGNRSTIFSQKSTSVLGSSSARVKPRPGPLRLASSSRAALTTKIVQDDASDNTSQRSVAGVSVETSSRSSTSRDPGWSSPAKRSARHSFYVNSGTVSTSSTPNLPSHQHPSLSSLYSDDELPPVPPMPGFFDSAPLSPLLQGLDPRLPITNTLPKSPSSPSAAIKRLFTRKPARAFSPAGISSDDPHGMPRRLEKTLRKSHMTSIPVTAFSTPVEVPTEEGRRTFVPPTGSVGPTRSVAAWAATLKVKDASLTRLDGLMHHHQELERERLNRIIGQGGRPRTRTTPRH